MVLSQTSASVFISRAPIPVHRGRILFLAAIVALLTASACGKGKDETPAGGSAPPEASTGTAGQVPPPETASSDWRLRVAGLPPIGDPRLNDLTFLRSLPASPEVDVAIGDCFLRQSQPESALVAYDRALSQNPESIDALNRRGIVLVRLDRLGDAEAAYKKAIQVDAFDPHSFTNLGNLYYRRGNFQQAVLQYTLSTGIDSTDASVWFNLGLAYEKLENVNEAIIAYGKAARTDLADPKPLERLGWIYYGRGLYKGARERWQEAVERDPSRTDLVDNIRRLQAYADSTETP